MKPNQKYMDLVVREINPSISKHVSGNYRFCTLSHRGGEFFINLRLPDAVQDKIITAYEQGKEVRIFA